MFCLKFVQVFILSIKCHKKDPVEDIQGLFPQNLYLSRKE